MEVSIYLRTILGVVLDDVSEGLVSVKYNKFETRKLILQIKRSGIEFVIERQCVVVETLYTLVLAQPTEQCYCCR